MATARTLKFTRTSFHHRTVPKVLIKKNDKSLSSQLPHGNSTTAESKNENLYRKLNATDSVNVKEQVAQAPRKLKQVQNMMQNLVQKLRFSQDSLYNLHNSAFDGIF